MLAAEALRTQAVACGHLGSPMYAELLAALADDLETGGPTAEVLAGHEDDPGPSALALRLAGSVHRLVLERRAGEVAAYYPSVGGTWQAEAGTRAVLGLLAEQPAAVVDWLDRPPQTNEVGRSAALMGGLLHLDDPRPVRLFEMGASAGLNLLADHYAYVDEAGERFGDPTSEVTFEPAWSPGLRHGSGLQLSARLGCDPHPLDATTTEGRLALTAYVWPDQRERLERLRGALAILRDHPVAVHRQSAHDFVDRIALREGATTVLWHSVMWQYLDDAEQAQVTGRIEELGASADEERPFARLSLEPGRRTPGSSHEFLVVLTQWPGGVRQILGTAAPHGPPVTWE